MKISVSRIREIIKEELVLENDNQSRALAEAAIAGDKDSAQVLVDHLLQSGDPRGKKLQSPVFWVRMNALLSLVGGSAGQRRGQQGLFYLYDWPFPKIYINCSDQEVLGVESPNSKVAFLYDFRDIAIFYRQMLLDKNGNYWRNGIAPGQLPLGNIHDDEENDESTVLSSEELRKQLLLREEFREKIHTLLEIVRFLGQIAAPQKKQNTKPRKIT